MSEAVLSESGHRRLRLIGLSVAVLTLLADQGHKIAMLYGLGFIGMLPGEGIRVTSFFNLIMVWNPGITYGLLPVSGMGTLILIAVVMAIVGFLGWWMWNATSLAVVLGCGLVIGGGLGNNLVDRLIYGKVADFFHFHAFGYNWYVFNIADVAVVLGAVAFIYDMLKPSESSNDA